MAASNLAILPKGWACAKIGEVYSILGGGTPSTAITQYWEGDIPWITSADINDLKDIRPKKFITQDAIKHSSTTLVPQDSLIVVTRVSLGKIAKTETPICFSQDSQALVGDNSIIFPDYALYYLSQAVQVFKHQHRGTTIAGVPKKQLAELSIQIPPINEQHRIVAKIEELFSDLDAGVEALKKAKAQLKQYRRAVLKAAFEGRLTAAWREAHKGELEPPSVILEKINEKRKKASQANFKEFAAVDAATLPLLPKEWSWARVGEVIQKMQYGTSEKAGSESLGIPVIRMGNIQEGKIRFDNLKYFSREWPDFEKYVLFDGDILFNRTNSAELVGKTAVYKKHFPSCVFASYLIRVVVLADFYMPDILSFYINSYYGRNYINSVVSQQVGQANVNSTKLSLMPIPLFSMAEQFVLLKEMERLFSYADEVENTIQQALKTSERLRQGILRKAFVGELASQDPEDEPAAELLERIKAEKAGQAAGSRSRRTLKRPAKLW